MNNKGFTLVELLCTVTIMALIATLAVYNLHNIFIKKETITQDNKNSLITTAACTYIELNKNKDLKNTCLTKGCTISSSILIKEGLIDSTVIDKEVNIKIYQENNEKKCSIE